ncbi:MAG: acetate kinase [Candidatus Atribacteria bacterium]|jgi:acetate kinase|nr:acetate kinase [Candidatus Atribacteria bacterium]
MKILVVNSGSSSIKYCLFDMTDQSLLAKGLVERIGIKGSCINHFPTGKDATKRVMAIPDHRKGIELVIDALLNSKSGVIDDISKITAVGHRVVHGGEKYSGSVLLNDDVINTLNEFIELAPLHNPPNILGIKVCQELLPDTPQVGVFDTAFHQSIPKEAFLYGLPYSYYEQYRIRRYGFHGTSHQYVAQRAAEILGKDIKELKIITCHIGNGSSITAVKEGKSVDTSLGFGTISGIIMGTRCGDVDPAIIPYLMEKENLSFKEINDILYRKSGFIGLSEGISSDMRDLEEQVQAGNIKAKRTLDVLFYGLKKYIGAYTAAMNGLDVLVFTAGIGENDPRLRKEVCQSLDFFGINIDDSKNDGLRGKEAIISTENSRVTVLVIPTYEELMIARDTVEICNNLK